MIFPASRTAAYPLFRKRIISSSDYSVTVCIGVGDEPPRPKKPILPIAFPPSTGPGDVSGNQNKAG